MGRQTAIPQNVDEASSGRVASKIFNGINIFIFVTVQYLQNENINDKIIYLNENEWQTSVKTLIQTYHVSA